MVWETKLCKEKKKRNRWRLPVKVGRYEILCNQHNRNKVEIDTCIAFRLSLFRRPTGFPIQNRREFNHLIILGRLHRLIQIYGWGVPCLVGIGRQMAGWYEECAGYKARALLVGYHSQWIGFSAFGNNPTCSVLGLSGKSYPIPEPRSKTD
jgi:hypothetical protein